MSSGLALLKVVPVPCWRDNYAYLVFFSAGDQRCLIVDACEDAPVQRELDLRGLVPLSILTTHHHWDHVGGNIALAKRHQIPVIGHASEQSRIPGMTQGVGHEEQLKMGNFVLRALHVPGHTQSGVSYVIEDLCFTGDTLFCGGCGRLKEGTAEQLHASLKLLVSRLPIATQLYTGHEYTETNLRFAQSLFPDPRIKARLAEVIRSRQDSHPCASASLAEELRTNLFLNCERPEVQRAVFGEDDWRAAERSLSANDLVQLTFTRLRQLKDGASGSDFGPQHTQRI